MEIYFKEEKEINAELKDLLSPAMKNDPLNTIESIVSDFVRKEVKIVAGYNKEKLLFAFVVRVDCFELGKELVVVCGSSKTIRATEKCLPVFEKIAKQNNCQSIRIHTAIKILGLNLLRNNFFESEIVYRKLI